VSDCTWFRTIPTARPREDYAQGYICLPCTSETARMPYPTCSVRMGSKIYPRKDLRISNPG
jgi:hypothetical protein